MRDGLFVIRRSDLESLTPAQRHALSRWLIRQAHEARARAIGAALMRLAGALCTLFWWPYEPKMQRSIAQRWRSIFS